MSNKEVIEILAASLRDAVSCGYSLDNGERVFCDDERLPESLRNPNCGCKADGVTLQNILNDKGYIIYKMGSDTDEAPSS